MNSRLLLCLIGLFGLFPALQAESPTDIVTEAFEDVLGRKPDQSGLSTFRSRIIEDGWTATDVRKALKQSDEYATLVITRSFQDVLGRKPDAGALNTYRDKIKRGWTEQDLRKVLRKSEEYRKKN
jgi:hypothetical protein